MSDWKEQLLVAADAIRRQTARSKTKRTVLPGALKTLQPGDAVYYVPAKTSHERYGQRAEVIRAPRPDVQSPSVRIRFPDGHEQTVPARTLRRTPTQLPDPPFLQDARSRPSWQRLVRAIAQGAEPSDIEQRARQLAGMVAPKGSPVSTTVDVPRVLLAAAQVEATAAQQRQAGRGGRGQPPPTHRPVPTDELATLRLDQEQRALVNRIALSIHRRYLLTDKELMALSDQERESRQIHGVLRQIVGLAEREAGTPDATSATGVRTGSALYGELQDTLTGAVPLALEACQMLIAGRTEHALTLALQVQERQLRYAAARRELSRTAVKHATGRYFHGDILSVRVEHVEQGAEGGSVAYLGMTQYYARLIVLYGADGHSLEIANVAELESVTGTRATPQAWGSLCRWIEDHSSRSGGRKQGRRQDDDEHLIYRDDDGHLRLRAGLEQYPDLLQAFEVIRRALHTTLRVQDITPPELGDAPQPGFHALEAREDARGA